MSFSDYDPPVDPSAIIGGVVFPIEDAIKELALSVMPEMPCEKCGSKDIVGLWSPDGLAGHEILVCRPCWQELTKGEEDGA